MLSEGQVRADIYTEHLPAVTISLCSTSSSSSYFLFFSRSLFLFSQLHKTAVRYIINLPDFFYYLLRKILSLLGHLQHRAEVLSTSFIYVLLPRRLSRIFIKWCYKVSCCLALWLFPEEWLLFCFQWPTNDSSIRSRATQRMNQCVYTQKTTDQKKIF